MQSGREKVYMAGSGRELKVPEEALEWGSRKSALYQERPTSDSTAGRLRATAFLTQARTRESESGAWVVLGGGGVSYIRM